MESGILVFGIRNPALRIRNTTKDWNPESNLLKIHSRLNWATRLACARLSDSSRAFFSFLFTERLFTTISEPGTGYYSPERKTFSLWKASLGYRPERDDIISAYLVSKQWFTSSIWKVEVTVTWLKFYNIEGTLAYERLGESQNSGFSLGTQRSLFKV